MDAITCSPISVFPVAQTDLLSWQVKAMNGHLSSLPYSEVQKVKQT